MRVSKKISKPSNTKLITIGRKTMSISEIAKASGLSYSYTSRVFNQKSQPSLKSMAAIAGAFGVRQFDVFLHITKSI